MTDKSDNVIDKVIREEQGSPEKTCPHCGEPFKNLDRHLKMNKTCGDKSKDLLQKKEPSDASEDDDKDEIENLGDARTPIAPPERNIKLISELPIENIPRMGSELAVKVRKSLASKDIITVYQLANADISEIKIADVGPKMWNAIISLACEAAGLSYMKPVTEIKNTSMVLDTGVPALNNLLSMDDDTGGGFETGEGYLIYGKNASGKTQICTKLACQIQLPVEKGGFYIPGTTRPDVVWIDTEEVAKSIVKPSKTGKSRLRQVARNSFLRAYPELDPDHNKDDLIKINEFVNEVEKHFLYCNAPNTRRQMQVVKTLLKDIASRNIKLIVVDSLIENFRVEYPGMGFLAERQQTLNTHLKDLRLLKENDAILVCTDQAVDNPAAGSFAGPPEFTFLPAGGNVIRHGVNVIMQLLPGKGGAKTAKIVDAGQFSPDSASFIINEFGIDTFGGILKKETKEEKKKARKAASAKDDDEEE